MNTVLSIGGYLHITKRDRHSGRVISTDVHSNAVTTDGKHAFLAEVSGESGGTADELNGSDGGFVIYDSNVTKQFGQTGTDAGPDHTNVEEVFYEWHDSSTNSYTPDSAEIRMGTSAGSEESTGTVFATIAGLELGEKPSTQIWEYKYTLGISGTGAFVDDTSGDAEGLDSMLMIFSGESGNSWGANTVLNIYNDSEVSEGSISSCVVTRDGTDLSYEWTADAGTLDNTDWQFMEIASELHVDDWPARYSTGKIPMWYNDHNIGNKPNNTKRIFKWTLSV